MEKFHPDVKTVIEIGGEDSKLILLERDERGRRVRDRRLRDEHHLRRRHRLVPRPAGQPPGLSIEDEFGELALKSENPPRVAGRCSVFAKTDMIHLQQQATPGLRHRRRAVLRPGAQLQEQPSAGARSSTTPIAFQGGVAANAGMVRAFAEVLELERGELDHPRALRVAWAPSARCCVRCDRTAVPDRRRSSRLARTWRSTLGAAERAAATPLELDEAAVYAVADDRQPDLHARREGRRPTWASTSARSAPTSWSSTTDRRVLARRYLMTAGRPIEAVQQGLRRGRRGGRRPGRRSAAWHHRLGPLPDRRLHRRRRGPQRDHRPGHGRAPSSTPRWTRSSRSAARTPSTSASTTARSSTSTMNKVCAAGTGSFLEEQAERLGISIKERVRRAGPRQPSARATGRALHGVHGVRPGHHQQTGAEHGRPGRGPGLLHRPQLPEPVVEDRAVGEQHLLPGRHGRQSRRRGRLRDGHRQADHRAAAPRRHRRHRRGASWRMEADMDGPAARSRASTCSKRKYEIRASSAQDCPNTARSTRSIVEGEEPLFYGSRCGSSTMRQEDQRGRRHVPDLFARAREDAARRLRKPGRGRPRTRQRSGIPRALLFYELYPVLAGASSPSWASRWCSRDTTNKTHHPRRASRRSPAETCFPVKVAHGHVLDLLDKGVDYIFLPSVINLQYTDNRRSCTASPAPMCRACPTSLRSAIDLRRYGVKVLEPVVYLATRREAHASRACGEVGQELGKSRARVRQAVRRGAQGARTMFYAALPRRAGARCWPDLRRGRAGHRRRQPPLQRLRPRAST